MTQHRLKAWRGAALGNGAPEASDERRALAGRAWAMPAVFLFTLVILHLLDRVIAGLVAHSMGVSM